MYLRLRKGVADLQRGGARGVPVQEAVRVRPSHDERADVHLEVRVRGRGRALPGDAARGAVRVIRSVVPRPVTRSNRSK